MFEKLWDFWFTGAWTKKTQDIRRWRSCMNGESRLCGCIAKGIKGETRWMIIDEAFNSEKLIEFLEALIKDAKKKVFLILDNLRTHHSKPVKAWVAARQDKIELFYLPSYSPELNPEERLNGDLKQVIGTKVPARTKAKLKSAAIEHMTELENDPERVKSYFQDKFVKYAAGQ